MDQLPQELISHIATFLEREDDQSHVPLLFRRREPSKLPPYATISRKWQYAIERLTFPEIWLKSTEMDYFSETMLAHRRRSLAVLQYEIVLPTYGEARCAKFETDDEKRLNNECFTDAIHALFRVMKSWEGTEGPETLHHTQAICLNLYAPYSPMDGIRRGPEKYKKDKWSSGIGERDDLWEHRYEHSVLRLSNSRDLPSLSSISELYGNLHYVRSIEPRSIVEILAKLDNLKSVRVTLKENEKKDRQMQQDDRKGKCSLLTGSP